jgi:N-acyl-D-amino-acid deacylase
MPEAEGKTIEELAALQGKDPFDAFFDLLIATGGAVSAVYHSIGDEDILKIIQLPYAMVGSDGVVQSATEKVHPRGWGAMVRAINLFTKERPVLTLEEMVRKMTSLPAKTYGLTGKGEIREGMDADLVLFDYAHLEDRATYQHPTELAGGIDAVFVGGEIVYENGKLTGRTPGKIIRHRV